VFDVDRRGGSIFLADSMDARPIAIGLNIFFKNLRAERTLAEGVMENGIGSAEKITLRESFFLR
jgi:hypothetical protein